MAAPLQVEASVIAKCPRWHRIMLAGSFLTLFTSFADGH